MGARFHNKYPTEAKLQVLKHALFDPKIPKLISPSAASASAEASSNNFKKHQQHNKKNNQQHPQLHQPTPRTSIPSRSPSGGRPWPSRPKTCRIPPTSSPTVF